MRTGPTTFEAQPSAQGPWSADHCHGGAPAALVAHAVRDVPTLTPMQIARVTLNLLRPVPIGELVVTPRIAREGRKLQLVDVDVMTDDGTLVTRAEVLRVRRLETNEGRNCPKLDLPTAAEGVRTRPPTGVGFSRLFEMQAVHGRFETPGPAAVWFRMSGDLVGGEPTDAVSRALACIDFANGIGAAVPFDEWSYPNADLSVYFAREPSEGWILLDADCWLGGEGRGVTRARLSDDDGWFGHSAQTVILDRRT